VLSSQACENQQNERCYVGFSLFRERFPEIIEGYTNAGVALERMGRLDDAKTLYRIARKKFPEHEKAVGPLLNVLQVCLFVCLFVCSRARVCVCVGTCAGLSVNGRHHCYHYHPNIAVTCVFQ
jgi:hypothetical protein